MNRELNPFAPGAGLQPPELVGRDRTIEDADVAIARTLQGRPAKGMIMLGLRGVGKTVLLNRLLRSANDRGCSALKIEAPEGGSLPHLLAPELRRILHELDLKKNVSHKVRRAVSVLRNFAAMFRVTVGEMDFGIEPLIGVADTGGLEQDLPALLIAIAEAAAEKKTAVVFFIDEIQYLAPVELAAIIVSCHEIAQRGLPLLFIGAGLPQIAALAGNAKSYAERLFNYPAIDKLNYEDASRALTAPALHEGVTFEDAAIRRIVEQTEGYPYFLQVWGSHVWDIAPGNPIVEGDVESALPEVTAHLDANFFRVRFDRLTALQQKYLRAMAELGAGPHATGNIANTLGVPASSVATVRQQLIKKGMIWSQRHGETAFTVPKFDQFICRQIPILEPHQVKRRPRMRPENPFSP